MVGGGINMKPNSFWNHTVAQNLGTYVPAIGGSKKFLNFSALENVYSENPLKSYPGQELEKLKRKIARWLEIKPDMVLLANGSDELINLIPQVFLEPGEKVVVQIPTFFRILESVHKMKGDLITVGATQENGIALDENFVLDLERTIRSAGPKIVWLCTPNNPTGVVMDVNLIDRIAYKTTALLIVDEAYQEIFDPENKQSAIHLIDKHPNILVTKSFSKAFGLAGIRVGFAIGNKKVIDILKKWQLNFPISTSSAQIASKALENINGLKRIAKNISIERKFLFEQMSKLGKLQLGGKSETNVFILRHRNKNLFELLLKEGIVSANFNSMNGLENQGFVRITIKTHEENMLLIEALRKINKI